MRIAQHISELIGGTPLVRLNSVVPDGAGTVAAKVEYLNPGGSSKDRIAVKMIEAAEASGQLKPGGTIVSSNPRPAIPALVWRWSLSAAATSACSSARTRSVRINAMC